MDIRFQLRQALVSGACLRLVLSRRRKGAAGHASRVALRPVEIRGARQYQLAARVGTQERHENLSPAAAADRVDALLGAEFLDAHLCTPEADWAASVEPDGSVRARRSKPTLTAVETAHDRPRRYLIPDGVPCPFLIETGVMTAAGRVKADRQHKFRQINRFLEFLDDIVPHLPKEGLLRAIDFGCGKSYLTFAVHHLLTAVHSRTVEIVGLDRNPAVIASCESIAGRLSCEGLSFRVGDIVAHDPEGKVHLAISLHACDTATDAALAQAVKWETDAILAAPCCQHELAPQLVSEELAPLLRHGILRERFASLVTDALRAERLEACGYRTQVLEFIDLEHTPKNLLIRAVRRPDDALASRAAADRLEQRLGVRHFALDDMLPLALSRVGSPDS